MGYYGRGFILVAVLAVPAGVLAGPSHQEISLSTAGAIEMVSGATQNGETKSYRLLLADDQAIVFSLEADNVACGSELVKTSQLGVLQVFKIFPASYNELAAKGERYTLSFFQNRASFMSRTPCVFSFSVAPKQDSIVLK
jgi:hypothetical protein